MLHIDQIYVPAAPKTGLLESLVIAQKPDQAMMVDGFDNVPLVTFHIATGDERVDYRLFGRVDRRRKYRVNVVVGQHANIGNRVPLVGSFVRRGKRDENVAGRVAGNAAYAGEPHRRTFGKPLQLMREQGRIGRGDDDDRTDLHLRLCQAGTYSIVCQVLPDRHTGYSQLVS